MMVKMLVTELVEVLTFWQRLGNWPSTGSGTKIGTVLKVTNFVIYE